jgi:transposase
MSATEALPTDRRGDLVISCCLNETVLRRWVMRLGGQATAPARRPITQAPVASPSDLAAENARLRRGNERLRMERDILKKAALIFGAASR